MTIKRYLFLLFSTLILTIAITQVVLLYVFKENIEEEIDIRSRDFADRIVNYAVDNLDITIESQGKGNETDEIIVVASDKKVKKPDFVVIEIEQDFDKHHEEMTFEVPILVIQQEDKLKQVIKELPAEAQHLVLGLSKKFNRGKPRKVKGENEQFEVKIFKPRSAHRHSVREKLKHQIERFRTDEKHYKREFIIKNDGVVQKKQTWLPSYREKHRFSLLNKMFNVTFFLIVVSTIISLIMVFWLSRRFSKPLQQLLDGFKELETGNFGVTIKPQGVEELKRTIERFNVMSNQLVKLAEAEHKLLQQSHLTELSDVSKGIAHALRNPMHTIGLAIEQLSNKDVPEPLKQKLLQKIQSKIVQLDKNIKALLTVTSGEIDRDSQVGILSVVQDIVLELKQSHQLLEVDLNVLVDVAHDLTLTGSEKELRSVLHTLVFNAYEACSQSKTQSINITITTEQVDNELIIRVTDNGGGIEDAIMQRMFEPHNSSKPEGAGMGLYISKRIIELYYNGELTITNHHDNEQISGAQALIKFSNFNIQE